jgi:hypothetical protein
MAFIEEDFEDSDLADLPQAEPLRFSFGSGVFEAGSDPDAQQDETKGFSPNSLWYFAAQGKLFICVDATAGAAVWQEIMMLNRFDTDSDGTIDWAGGIRIFARNTSTTTAFNAGEIVYLDGATGNRPNIFRARADSETQASRVFGAVAATIGPNQDGPILFAGSLSSLNTAGFAEGDKVWLSPTVAGGLTTTRPEPPNHSIFIGYVTRSHPTQGRIVYHVEHGDHLEWLHDVKLTGLTNGQILKYDTAQGLWINADESGGGGNAFGNIAVAGQDTIEADSATDTLTLVAGANITITTNAATDTLTINAAGGAGGGDLDFGTFGAPAGFTLDLGAF